MPHVHMCTKTRLEGRSIFSGLGGIPDACGAPVLSDRASGEVCPVVHVCVAWRVSCVQRVSVVCAAAPRTHRAHALPRHTHTLRAHTDTQTHRPTSTPHTLAPPRFCSAQIHRCSNADAPPSRLRSGTPLRRRRANGACGTHAQSTINGITSPVDYSLTTHLLTLYTHYRGVLILAALAAPKLFPPAECKRQKRAIF